MPSTVSAAVGFALMASPAIGAMAGAIGCVAASPYLARLTCTVPDRELTRWWTGRTAGRRRLLLTASTALVFGALAGAAAGWTALLPAFLMLALIGVPLTVIDFECHRLPNRLMYPLAGSALLLLAVAAAVRADWSQYLRAVEGGAAVYAVLFLLSVVSPRSFGRGDVRLGGVLGLYLGWHGWLSVWFGVFAGFLLGTLVALPLLASGRASLKTALAFGPMMLLGALVVLAFDLTSSLFTPT